MILMLALISTPADKMTVRGIWNLFPQKKKGKKTHFYNKAWFFKIFLPLDVNHNKYMSRFNDLNFIKSP